jgi:hypothetical protein
VIERLRQRCAEQGLRTVARRIGVDGSNLRKVLAGLAVPSARLLQKVTAFLAHEGPRPG